MPVALGQRARQLVLGQPAVLDEVLAQPLARRARGLQRSLDRLPVGVAELDDDVPQEALAARARRRSHAAAWPSLVADRL